MAQAKYSHQSDNQEIKLHYDMLIADHYNINISFDYQANSAIAIARIITVLCTSPKGTDVELQILKKNNEISFVRYNLPALKTEELKDLELEIYNKPNGSSGAESHYSVLQRQKLKRKIQAHESNLTTHTALMFEIDVEQEIFKGLRRKKQSVFYIYTNCTSAKQQIDQELKKAGLCTDGMTPLSPSLSLATLTWIPSDFQREPFSDLRLLPRCDLSVQSLGRAANKVKMMYGLLLADHYQLNMSAEFMTNSDEAVVSVLTRIETTPTGSEVDIQFQKRNRQVSFVRFEMKDLKTTEFKDFEVDIKYDDPEVHKRGYTRCYSPMTNINQSLTIPKSQNTTQIKMAYIFNVTTEGCTEPKVLFIYAKDHVVVPVESLPTFEEIEPFEAAIQPHRRAMSEVQHSTIGKAAVERATLKSKISEVLGPENSESHFVGGQTSPKKKIKSVSIREAPHPMAAHECPSTDTFNVVESAAGKTHQANLANSMLNKPDTEKPVPKCSEEKIKFHDKGIKEHILETIKNCFSDSLREDETTCVFDVFSGELSSTMEQVMEKVELGKNVILNTFNITNHINFNFGSVQHAVVGQGDINIHECCKSPNNLL